MEGEQFRRRLEAPAGRAVRLVRTQADDGHRNDFVDVIREWTRAWRLVISIEDAIAHSGVPSLHSIRVGYPLESYASRAGVFVCGIPSARQTT